MDGLSRPDSFVKIGNVVDAVLSVQMPLAASSPKPVKQSKHFGNGIPAMPGLGTENGGSAAAVSPKG
jgi:hypothetical protein